MVRIAEQEPRFRMRRNSGGAAGGVSSLIAGDVQFLGGGGGGVISAALGGADVLMIGSIVNKGVQRVVARSDIKRPEDLRGKKIGVTRLGAASHLVLLIMLRGWNDPAFTAWRGARIVFVVSLLVTACNWVGLWLIYRSWGG